MVKTFNPVVLGLFQKDKKVEYTLLLFLVYFRRIETSKPSHLLSSVYFRERKRSNLHSCCPWFISGGKGQTFTPVVLVLFKEEMVKAFTPVVLALFKEEMVKTFTPVVPGLFQEEMVKTFNTVVLGLFQEEKVKPSLLLSLVFVRRNRSNLHSCCPWYI